MNDTKWMEIFQGFYYGAECSHDPALAGLKIHWTTKTTDGYVYRDTTWTHFGCSLESAKEIEWLRIDLTKDNRDAVLEILHRIHVPGEIIGDAVYVYGYRTDVDYL